MGFLKLIREPLIKNACSREEHEAALLSPPGIHSGSSQVWKTLRRPAKARCLPFAFFGSVHDGLIMDTPGPSEDTTPTTTLLWGNSQAYCPPPARAGTWRSCVLGLYFHYCRQCFHFISFILQFFYLPQVMYVLRTV